MTALKIEYLGEYISADVEVVFVYFGFDRLELFSYAFGRLLQNVNHLFFCVLDASQVVGQVVEARTIFAFEEELFDLLEEDLEGEDFVGLVVFHAADGADDSPAGTGGIDADEVHDLAGVEVAVGALSVVEVHFLDGGLQLHQI